VISPDRAPDWNGRRRKGRDDRSWQGVGACCRWAGSRPLRYGSWSSTTSSSVEPVGEALIVCGWRAHTVSPSSALPASQPGSWRSRAELGDGVWLEVEAGIRARAAGTADAQPGSAPEHRGSAIAAESTAISRNFLAPRPPATMSGNTVEGVVQVEHVLRRVPSALFGKDRGDDEQQPRGASSGSATSTR